MTHPLTDEILEQFGIPVDLCVDSGRIFCAYDMRAVTDWQLEQCIEWLEILDSKYFLAKHITLAKMMREAMRPTQEDNNG